MGDIGKTKSLVIKIVVPILLLCVIAGIWLIKNSKKDIYNADIDNPDFELHQTESIDLDKLKSYGLPIIIDFGADSCIPCKEMAPALKELNEELKGKAIIKFVDVWKYQAAREGYPLRSIPTQFFIDSKGNPYNPEDPDREGMILYSTKDSQEHVYTAHEGGMTKEQLLAVLRKMGLK